MNTDKLRQQITVVTNDLPALEGEGASGDDFARHLVARLRVATDNALEYLVDDPHTKVIGGFIETIRSPDRFVAALDRAAAQGKPVVVLKVGRTERTRHAVTTHTGGLAGEPGFVSELLRAHRAIEVSDLVEFTEVLAAAQGARSVI
jgi:acetyltransferase